MNADGDEFEREYAALIERGYRDITKHKRIEIGARVRHVGRRWPDAYRNGTATILAVMERNPSGWAMQWGRPDIELLAAQDDPERGIGRWADYHVEVIAAWRGES